jgi:NADPH-dependent 2,4-dienoyl-CoA reductase/sulfur reductase-like enzyme
MSRSARRYLILGAGVGGMAAAQAIRSVDPGGEIGIVSNDPFGYYSRPGLAYYLTGEADEKLLFPFSRSELKELRLGWHTARAICIDPAGRRVQLDNQAWLPYDRLLVTTGSLATPLGVPGANSQGVLKLDSLGDARMILQAARRARSAVVAGGGITALELVEGLRAQGLQVHYFMRGERYWNNVLDETESQIVEQRLAHEGVHIHNKTELAEIQSRKSRVSAVVTKDGRQISCELVAFAIGVKPRVELAREAGLRVDRGICVDERLQTSHPDIFAAGDAAQVFDPYSGQSVVDTLWSTARQQGHAAGLNMAGHVTTYTKSVPLNVTRLAGLTTTIIGTVGRGVDESLVGIARGDSETWRRLPDAVTAEASFEVNRLRLLVGEQRLLGAIVMGDQALSIPLQTLIDRQADVTPIRDQLLRSDRLGDTLASFWVKWRAEHANAQS